MSTGLRSVPDPAGGNLQRSPWTASWIYGDMLLRAEEGEKGDGMELRGAYSTGLRSGVPIFCFVSIRPCLLQTRSIEESV